MRRKSWAVFCTMFAGLPALAQDFRGKVIFSVEVVEWAQERNTDGSKGPKRRTGVFCYHEEARTVSSDPSSAGYNLHPSLTCYKLKDGEVVQLAGSGSEEAGVILQTLREMPLSTFNVQNEIDAVNAKLRATGGAIMMVADGANYRIQYDFNGVSIDYTGWNPGPHIGFLARHSENLRSLNEVINVFALLYGRREFGL